MPNIKKSSCNKNNFYQKIKPDFFKIQRNLNSIKVFQEDEIDSKYTIKQKKMSKSELLSSHENYKQSTIYSDSVNENPAHQVLSN